MISIKQSIFLTAGLLLMTGCQKNAAQQEQAPAQQTDCKQAACEIGICDQSSGKCTSECTRGTDCRLPEKPVCSKGICIACSAEHACYEGFCDTASGRCVDCLTDHDCTTRERGLCISNVCTTCSTSNCSQVCNEITGKCEPPVDLPCPGGNCGAPAPIVPIDPVVINMPSPPVVIVLPPQLNTDEAAPEIGSYNIDANVTGMFATVSTEFTITNSNNRVLEGNLEFPLPDDAVVSGYAIDVDGVMVEASVVEKKKARIAFENETKKGIDPGIVEQVKGNAYRTRIYPIPAHGSRRIRVEYTTPLVIAPNGDAALSLPMPKKHLAERNVTIRVAADMPTPAIGGLGDARFMAAKAEWRVDTHETDVTPTEDILVAMPQLPDVVTSIQQNRGDVFFAASVKIAETAVHPIDMPTNWRIIWDASGSRKPADIEQAKALINQLPEAANYELHTFRNELEPVKTFTSRTELLAAIDAMPYDGSTDFSVLESLVKQAFAGQTLFFTDGMDTFKGALPEFGTNCIAVVSGAERDMSALRRICGGRAFNITTLSAEDTMKQILAPAPVVSAFTAQNINNIQGIGLPASGRITILGRINGQGSRAEIELSDGRRIPVDLTFNSSAVTSGNTLAAAWAARRIDELSPRAENYREELLAIGRRFKLVSPVSSMIVLETLSQYLEYGIEPPESLPEMHAKWLRSQPSEAQRQMDEKRKYNSWMHDLESEWNSRIAWWNNPSLFNIFDPESSEEESDSGNDGMMVEAESIPAEEAVMAEPSSADNASPSQQQNSVNAAVSVKEWNPQTPYIQAIRDAQTVFNSVDSAYEEYLRQRTNYASSPAFFFDCASYFFNQKAAKLGLRILSNLSEISIDSVELLRVYAWRLRENGNYKTAVIILKKVAKLRPDEAVSWRDLALTYTMIAKQDHDAAATELALQYYYKAAFTPYDRGDALASAIVALEEFNELAAWSRRQNWNGTAPVIPHVDSKFTQNLDTDLRIAMMWDADNTDIDIHVVDPSGEEIFYNNKHSKSGGMISKDIVTGYGPEEVFFKIAPKGKYTVKTKYFASHQQTLIGPATITVMYYTNWGRENQESHIMSLRLDQPREIIEIGTLEVK